MQDAEHRVSRGASHRAFARVGNISYGAVLKARDCRDGSIVAIKSETATGGIRESAATDINTLKAVELCA
jgi:hypothetical protein